MGFHIFRLLCIILVATILFHGSCYSDKAGHYTFMKDAIIAPTYARFDYIVIGGGTSGCALAATLSQNASVLVLERGGSPYDNPTATDLGNIIPSSWSQPFTSKDGVDNKRPRILGGGTVINGGFYTRAGDDYVAESKWEMEEVETAYEWIEKKLVFEPQVIGWQSAFINGLLEADVAPYNGFTYDHINGTKIGGTIFDIGGHRHSAADLLEYANPDMIVVYVNATVHKILFTTEGVQRPKAHGVIYQDGDGGFHKAELVENVMNEVILSAGALGSPQLLMLSGVGPRAHLEAHGVNPVVLDHPMVGKGMGDNPSNSVVIPSPLPLEVAPPSIVGITKFGSFIEGASLDVLRHTPSTKSIAHFVQFMNLRLSGMSNSGLILQKVDGPVSRGYLELQNTNPDDNPSVTFNYYQEPEDLEKCVKGLETIIKVVNSKAFSKYKYPNATPLELLRVMLSLPFNLRPRHRTAMFNLTQFCIDTVTTIYHYHGGCQVGRVVDKNYKVIGIDSLRVIDGSTFLKSPGTNPQGTVMMLGRYMGQKIIQERVSFEGNNDDDSIKRMFLWKLQRRFRVGQEKKLSKANATLKRMCAQFISPKREEITIQNTNGEGEDLLTSHMKLDATKYELLNPSDEKFLRDTMLSFILAGRDTTASALTWFFWILSENPQVVTKILQEINTILPRTSDQKRPCYDDDSMQYCLNKLVYLHGALYMKQ